MKQLSRFFIPIIVFWALTGFIACKSDTSASGGNNAPDSGKNQDAATSLTADMVSEKGNLEEVVAEARELEKKHEAWKQEVKTMREAFRAIPYEVRQNAIGSDELEARLDDFVERGDFMIDEMKQIAQQLEAAMKGDKSDEELPRCLLVINDHRKTLPEVEENLAVIKKAIEQLKAAVPSKGKGVVLFH